MQPSTQNNRHPDRRPQLCATAPLLWSLIPLIAGILAGWHDSAWLSIGGLSGSLGWALCNKLPHRCMVPISFVGGLVLMSLESDPAHPDWSTLPPREVVIHLEVTRLFNARKPGHLAGIGEILQAALPHDTITGSKIAFYLKDVSNSILQKGTGQVLECRGVLTYLPAAAAPSPYQLYLSNRDIFLSINQGDILDILQPPPPIECLRLRAMSRARTVLTHGRSGPDHPGRVLASMVLGDRSLLDDTRITLYRRTGTFHLFAVSGLHVGSFTLCLGLLARVGRLPERWRLIPVLAGTWAYVWLTGSSPSSVRAGIMISCAILARSLLRQPHLFPAMTLSAWLVLALNPRQLFDLGFQLSYGVVASIILTGLPLAQYFREQIDRRMGFVFPLRRSQLLARKFLHGAAGLACVSLSAGMASMPLIVQHFSLFTPGGLILGFLLNPLATLSVMLGCLSMLSGYVCGILPAGWIAMATWPLIRLMEWLLQLCLTLPGAVYSGNWLWPPTGTLLLITALLLAWWLQWLRQSGRVLPPLFLFLPPAIVATGLATISINA